MRKVSNNNPGAKWVIVIFTIVLISSIFVTEIMAAKDRQLEVINIDRYIKELSIDGEKLILLTKKECTKCNGMDKVLQDIKAKEKKTIYSLNIDKLSTSDMSQLLDSSTLVSKTNVPMILHVSAGAIIGGYTGDANYDDIMNFASVFKKISVKQYLDLAKEDVEHFVYIGRPTCGYCVQSAPWAKRISHDLNKDIYYINIDNETAVSLEQLTQSTNNIYQGSTPLFLITKNNQIIKYQKGAESYTALNTFFNGTSED